MKFFLLQGEYYNADEVQAMVAAEILEEKKKKKEEEEMFDDIGAETGQVEGSIEKRTLTPRPLQGFTDPIIST